MAIVMITINKVGYQQQATTSAANNWQIYMALFVKVMEYIVIK